MFLEWGGQSQPTSGDGWANFDAEFGQPERSSSPQKTIPKTEECNMETDSPSSPKEGEEYLNFREVIIGF